MRKLLLPNPSDRAELGGNYLNIDANGKAELRQSGSNQTFYLENKGNNQMGNAQVTLKMPDGRYLGISGQIKDDVQVNAVNDSYLWNISFATGGLRPPSNPEMVVNASSQKYTDGTKIILWTSKSSTPDNARYTVSDQNTSYETVPDWNIDWSFEKVREKAFEGSDYDDIGSTGEEVSTFTALTVTLLSIGLPMGMIIWFFRMKKKLAEKKRQRFAERFGYLWYRAGLSLHTVAKGVPLCVCPAFAFSQIDIKTPSLSAKKALY